MNGETIKEFLVGLGFDVQGEQAFDSAIGKATVLAVGLGAACFGASAALFKLAESTANYFDALGDMSNRTGIAVNDIEEFSYVAQLTGSSVEAATSSLENFSRAAGDAANGMGRGQKVFEQLGIKVEDGNGKLKDTSALLGEVGDKIKDMDKGKQTAILGRLGLDRTLVDALTTDVSGLRKEFQNLYASAGIDSEAAAQKSGAFMDSLDRLGFVLATVGRSLAVNFMDKFTDAMDKLRKMIVDNLPLMMRVLKPIINVILAITETFIALAYRASQGLGVIIGWIADLNDATDGWAVGIGALILAWKYLNLAFLATPIGAILGLAVAVGLLIDDFMIWQEGGESLVPWGNWASEIEAIVGAFQFLRSALEAGFMNFFILVDAIVKLFSGDFSGAISNVKEVLLNLLAVFASAFGPALDELGNQFAYVGDAAGGVASTVADSFSSAIASVKEVLLSLLAIFDAIFGPTLDKLQNKFSDVFGNIKAFVQGAIEFIVDKITSLGGALDGIVGKVSGAVDWVKGAASKASNMFSFPESGPTTEVGPNGVMQTALPLGMPQTATPLGADAGIRTAVPSPGQQNINQETTININGSGDPQATGRAVGGHQNDVNGNMARNLRGVVR